MDKYLKFYHSKEWKLARSQALARDHYLCQVCLKRGLVKSANTVHHIIPIKDDFKKRLHQERGSNEPERYKKLKARKRKAYVFKANPDYKL